MLIVQHCLHPHPGPPSDSADNANMGRNTTVFCMDSEKNVRLISRNIRSLNNNLIAGLIGGADFIGLQEVDPAS